jgi:TPR repeat protein
MTPVDSQVLQTARALIQRDFHSLKNAVFRFCPIVFLLLSLGCRSTGSSSTDLTRKTPSSEEIALNQNLTQAATGDAQAQYLVGSYYAERNGALYQNYLIARNWLSLSAKQGNTNAESLLARVEQTESKREELFLEFKTKAENGDAQAQENLGKCYQNEQGVVLNTDEAVKWYRKSAEQHYAPAQRDLGSCYEWGVGVTKDWHVALLWYRDAAQQGDALGQYALGFMYETGMGTPRDYVTAYFWDYLAFLQGDKTAASAAERLTAIVNFLTPAPIDEAKALAIQFRQGKAPGN